MGSNSLYKIIYDKTFESRLVQNSRSAAIIHPILLHDFTLANDIGYTSDLAKQTLRAPDLHRFTFDFDHSTIQNHQQNISKQIKIIKTCSFGSLEPFC